MLALSLLTLGALAASPAQSSAPNWNQGPGPMGNWHSEGVDPPPLRFSVRTGENILWRTPLPETGQGGIAVWEDRVFVATMAPWDESMVLSEEEAALYRHATENRKVVGKHIDAHCLDANTGKILWSRRIEGEVPAIYSYPFSDATSSSPVTDGEHVWFTNAGGKLVCFTVEGEPVWERRWTPNFDGPFNKQFEPILVRDMIDGEQRRVLIHMEPRPAPDTDDPKSLHGRWHYLFGLDAKSGELLWQSEDALTQYNAPTQFVVGEQPIIGMLHARGGPHAVPERPVGMSLTAIAGPRRGESVARFDDPRGNHEASLHTMTATSAGVCWVMKEPRSAVAILDPQTLQEDREISLTQGVQHRERDPETGEWTTHEGIDLERGVFPARYTALGMYIRSQLYFQCYATAWGKPTIGPAYSFARVDTASGKVEYLEVPSGVARVYDEGTGKWQDQYIWRTPQQSRAINSSGVERTGDDRSRWDGWDWVFNGSPTCFNNRLYFTTASGLVYVLDAHAKQWDESALLAVNDLGPAGETWSANSLSICGGKLFHRTARELICVGEAPSRSR